MHQTGGPLREFCAVISETPLLTHLHSYRHSSSLFDYGYFAMIQLLEKYYVNQVSIIVPKIHMR